MNVADLRALVKKLINSFSADGQLLPLSDNADVDLVIVDYLNTAYFKAIEFDKVESVYSFTQNVIPNLLNVYNSFNLLQHLDQDLMISAIGAKSYTFEVDHPATIYVEESIAGVWVNLSTLTITDITSFTEYKGLITPSNIANAVQIRFSGLYIYNIRRTALYGYSFPLVSEIPSFKPYMKYALPDDYIKMNKIVRNGDDRLCDELIDYRIERRNLVINYFIEGSFDAYYFSRPAPLVLDADIPLIQAQHHAYLAYFAAGEWLIASGRQADGVLRINQYDAFIHELKPVVDEVNGTITNSTNW
jgi:hypothetical protein